MRIVSTTFLQSKRIPLLRTKVFSVIVALALPSAATAHEIG